MRKRRRAEVQDTTGIDLAPMLDFVLNLLIFFIITAVFVKEVGMRVERHGGGAAGPAGEKTTGSISIVILAAVSTVGTSLNNTFTSIGTSLK